MNVAFCLFVCLLLGKNIPSKEAILLQIRVCMKAMPMYVSLPTFSEYMIEKGWTRCYLSISEVNVVSYFILTFLYLVLVEFGIYWMHRTLHDCKPMYKWLHATHHIYNKENTLSPFAGIIFLGAKCSYSRICFRSIVSGWMVLSLKNLESCCNFSSYNSVRKETRKEFIKYPPDPVAYLKNASVNFSRI